MSSKFFQNFKISPNTATMIDKLNNSVKVYSSSKIKKCLINNKLMQLKRYPTFNPILEKCTSLKITAQIFCNLIDMNNYIKEKNKLENSIIDFRCIDTYYKLYEHMVKLRDPSDEDMEAMFLVSKLLLDNKIKHKFEEFIFNCPKKFIIKYSNNQDISESVFYKLDKLGLYNVRSYLISHINKYIL